MNYKVTYNEMSDRQDQVLTWLTEAKKKGVSRAFIAKRLGMTPQNLNYHLVESPELDLDLYHSILRELRKYDVEGLPPSPKIVDFPNAIPVYEYPLLGTVYAGAPEMLEHSNYNQMALFSYSKPDHRCFALRVSGQSMNTTLRDGDTILVDMDIELIDGCLAAVVTKNGHQYVKRYYNLNDDYVKLTSDNPDYGVIVVNKSDIQVAYRVVMIALVV